MSDEPRGTFETLLAYGFGLEIMIALQAVLTGIGIGFWSGVIVLGGGWALCKLFDYIGWSRVLTSGLDRPNVHPWF